MKVLTVRNPWAWAISVGAKVTENRTGGPGRWGYRGPLLIHAGKGWSSRGPIDPRIIGAWRAAYPHDVAAVLGVRNVPAIMRPGQIVARCVLVDAHPAGGCCGPWGEDEYVDADGRRRTNIVHLTLEAIEPIYLAFTLRGRLGLWAPPDGVEGLCVPAVRPGATVTP